MQNVSDSRLEQIRRARRGLEVDAAKIIGKYLIANQRQYIQRLILQMIEKMLSLFDGSFLQVRVASILARQTSFAMWSLCQARPDWKGLERVRECVATHRLGDYRWLNVCSDVIRLFGEFAESSVISDRLDVEKRWGIMKGKDKLRPEPVYAKPGAGGWGHRHRRGATTMVQVKAPFVDIPRERVKWRGVERFQFGEQSVVKTIDWTYGLPIEGGDVSGTTTDSIAALRWACSGRAVNPIAQLIAIATMVPQGHHTIVECAWPLTRHGYMDYVIGFYETLVPPGEGYAVLRASLMNLDRDARNQHVLVCFGTNRAGTLNCHFNQRDEVREYRKIAGVRSAYSFCVGGRADARAAENMMQAHRVSREVRRRFSEL